MSKGQHVIRTRGYYIVLSRIARQHRAPGEVWEVEITSPRGRTVLRYKRNLLVALRTIYRVTRKTR
jgi:hypothetical protein